MPFLPPNHQRQSTEGNQFLMLGVSEKYVYIISLEMASPGNRHCANSAGTVPILSAQCRFPVAMWLLWM